MHRLIARNHTYIQATYGAPSARSFDVDFAETRFVCLSSEIRLVGVIPSIRFAIPYTKPIQSQSTTTPELQ